ncbi:DUF5708 family protein [Streptomyces leeuwenhoekii]|uniref:Uncharacterized protein n=1 Tax=Streptomyces leeuwenhoekii TaxID=1437453 RepID=A0A0F7VXX6_STRLW|nr:DUF5708 family protein [Streptomyces leeuwenhoekii]CQR61736.1 Hypothetical Protein SCO [Streptomyces leeuwenhoekii]
MRIRTERHLWEGSATFLVGFPLWLFADGVEVPFVTLTKVGLVMVCVGGAQVLWGLYRAARARTPGPPLGSGPAARRGPDEKP